MTGATIGNQMADAARRLAQLRAELESGVVERSTALEQAVEDLSVSLEELETTNDELAASKFVAEEEGRRYRELFQLIPAACLVTDGKGVVLEANRATEQLLGHGARFLVGKPFSAFAAASDHSLLFRLLDRLTDPSGAPVQDEELRMRDASGRLITVGVTAVPLFDHRATRTGARWLVRDLTTQLRQERDRRQAGDREAYRHIAGGVIHHLNNLLASIRGYAEIISRVPAPGERIQRAAGQILSGTERGERLTEQLLAFARAGGSPVAAKSVNAIVHEACEMGGELLAEGTRIERDLSDDAPSVRIDALGLYQAMLNLILNSGDALDRGGEVEVASRVVELDEEQAGQLELDSGRYVTLIVSDSGPGMDTETRLRATEPFFSTKAIGSGFGLGLSTAEAIAHEAGGALQIDSSPGAGTQVALYIPCAPGRGSRRAPPA